MRLLSSIYVPKPIPPVTIIADGDSITAANTNPGQGSNSYCVLAQTFYAAGYGQTNNVAVPGSVWADLLSRVSSSVTPLITAAHAAGRKAICSAFCGTNDIAIASGTALTTWAGASSYFAACRAAGADYCIGWTILPRTGGISTGTAANFDAQRRTFNLQMRAAYGSIGLDAFVDIAAEPAMALSTNTYYFVDGIHPSVAGQWVLSQRFASVILGILGQGRTRIASSSASGGPLAGGTTVDINGSGFVGASGVTLAGLRSTYSVMSDSLVRATSPVGVVTGTGDIVIMGRQGAGRLVGAWTYS